MLLIHIVHVQKFESKTFLYNHFYKNTRIKRFFRICEKPHLIFMKTVIETKSQQLFSRLKILPFNSLRCNHNYLKNDWTFMHAFRLLFQLTTGLISYSKKFPKFHFSFSQFRNGFAAFTAIEDVNLTKCSIESFNELKSSACDSLLSHMENGKFTVEHTTKMGFHLNLSEEK